MSEELQKRLEDYLSTLEDSISSSSEFILEQTPQLVQEYLNWYFYSNLLIICIGIGILVCLGIFTKVAIPYLNKMRDKTDRQMLFVALWVTITFSGLLIVTRTLMSTYCLLKVVTAPRLVLLEKITEILP